MKKNIRKFVLEMGVDDVGFITVQDYLSPRSPKIETIFPEAKSIIVMVYRELSNCESSNMQIAMNGRLDLMEFSRSCNYKLAKFIERNLQGKAMTISASYPLEMSHKTSGSIGDVSLRHAAVSAGLGTFGRHNLVIHPEFGTRVIFSAVLCNLDLASDGVIEKELCTGCNTCIQECPAGALNEEGKTSIGKCLKQSQPYGLGATIKFWHEYAASNYQEQQQMIKDEHFWRLYQAGFIGFQYFCFKCFVSCPVGKRN